MTSQQIQTLLAPPNIKESHSNVLHLLNSRFNSVDDLDDLDSALKDARSQNDLLSSELVLSKSKIDTLISESRTFAEGHLHSAQELSLLRHSLADELSYLSQELVSSVGGEERKTTLLEDIEALHRNLKDLQSVKGYVQVIKHALKLSEAAVEQIRVANLAISPASVTEYKTLQEFVATIKQSCSEIKDGSGQQNLQLVTILERVRDGTWADIKGVLSATLLNTAEKLHWPMPVNYASGSAEDRKAFENAFLDLLRLQNIGEKIQPLNPEERTEKDGLYPLQALVQPLSLRFKYHFEGTRQTNRLDKPEWYFTHVLNVVHEHRPFMDSVIQNLISSTEYRGIHSWREFTRLLFPLLSRKLKRTVPTLLPHPSLLAHTIYQTLAFDAALLEEGFGISGTSASGMEGKWDGVSEVVLGKKEWFDAWVDGEKRFAEDQYHEIISAPEAWLIADDDEGSQDMSAVKDLKPTNSARRIRALVEQITDRYSPLPRFAQRTRFLISVQLPLLECYHDRISSSLDAFETLSSVFVRAVPGSLGVSLGGREDTGVNVDTQRLTSGVEGVQRLSKALVSAKFLRTAMEAWGEELFFLELWAEINHRGSLRVGAEANKSLPDPKISEADVPEGTIFQELVGQYNKLVSRAEDMIVQQVCGEVEGGWKVHLIATTSIKPNPEQSDDMALSQTLLAPIALLSSHLAFLRSTLPIPAVTALYRRISSHLADHFLQRQILHRGYKRISLRECKSIMAESELWVEACHAALGGMGRNRVEAPWLNLLQAGMLLSGEQMWDRVVDLTFGSSGDAEWEEGMSDVIGVSELGRDRVATILRSREDCER